MPVESSSLVEPEEDICKQEIKQWPWEGAQKLTCPRVGRSERSPEPVGVDDNFLFWPWGGLPSDLRGERLDDRACSSSDMVEEVSEIKS